MEFFALCPDQLFSCFQLLHLEWHWATRHDWSRPVTRYPLLPICRRCSLCGQVLSLSTEFPSVGLPAPSRRSSAVNDERNARTKHREVHHCIPAISKGDVVTPFLQALQPACRELNAGPQVEIRVGHVSLRNVTPEEPFSKPNQDHSMIHFNWLTIIAEN